MTREEMKKKIVEVLDNKQTHGVSLEKISDDGPIKIVQIYTPNEDIADALIAAGIGDISAMLEYLKSASKNAEEQRKNLIEIQNTQLDDLNNLRKYAERRAEVAERAFDLMLKHEKNLRCINSFTNCDKNCEECWDEYFSRQKQGYFELAEKELEEEAK